jgi:hypothetical protein
MTITDRLRWTVIQANTREILTYDLNVQEPEAMIMLSAPSHMAFKIPQTEQLKSAAGITWKNWGHIIVCEVEIDYVRRIFGYGIVNDHKIDPDSGVVQIETIGPIGYAKGEPWLENFNPVAVDPFEVVQRVWAYLQSFSDAQLGIEITPASSGTQMLPGYGFDGSILNFDFFAMFIRAVDLPDSGDTIMGLARDIPFDMFEEATWNSDRTELAPQIRMAYPYGGIAQDALAFRSGENVKAAEIAQETEVEPVNAVIIRSWLPGKMMSSSLTNADPTRFRRTAIEEDLHIDSTERAAAWARRKLTRRQIPRSFEKITVLLNHPHAPFGSYGLGDSIFIEYPNYPWVGDIAQWHRITSISPKLDDGLAEIGVKVEGAFNYDPITYDPNYDTQPVEDPNRLANGYFSANLMGWTSLQGQWFRVTDVTFDTVFNPLSGSVRVDCDDNGERFLSHRAFCTPGETLHLQAAVRWQEVTSGVTDAFQLLAFTSHDGTPVSSFVVDEHTNPTGVHAFEVLEADWLVPDGVNEVALQFTVTTGVDAGVTWWTFARVVPV